MAGLRAWLLGWRKTLAIRLFEPELYRHLTQPLVIEDFGEVPQPSTEG